MPAHRLREKRNPPRCKVRLLSQPTLFMEKTAQEQRFVRLFNSDVV